MMVRWVSRDTLSNQLRLRFGKRSFSHAGAGPSARNALPSDICAVGGHEIFQTSHQTILVWLLVYINGFMSYLQLVYVTIAMHPFEN